MQIRVTWEENTVVLWNNSTTIHSPCVDFDEPEIRHAYRISVMGERPVGDLKYLNDENYLQEKYNELGIQKVKLLMVVNIVFCMVLKFFSFMCM